MIEENQKYFKQQQQSRQNSIIYLKSLLKAKLEVFVHWEIFVTVL